MERLEPDFILEKEKNGRLPPSLNSGVIINQCPIEVGIEINHNKFQEPTITLLPVKEKVKEVNYKPNVG